MVEKKVRGIKRHIAVDSLGLPIALVLTSANIHDSAVSEDLVRMAHQATPHLAGILADAGYRGKNIRMLCARLALKLTITTHPTGGFVLQKKRWIVERTFAWLTRCRRLDRARERSFEIHCSFIELAFLRLVTLRLC